MWLKGICAQLCVLQLSVVSASGSCRVYEGDELEHYTIALQEQGSEFNWNNETMTEYDRRRKFEGLRTSSYLASQIRRWVQRRNNTPVTILEVGVGRIEIAVTARTAELIHQKFAVYPPLRTRLVKPRRVGVTGLPVLCSDEQQCLNVKHSVNILRRPEVPDELLFQLLNYLGVPVLETLPTGAIHTDLTTIQWRLLAPYARIWSPNQYNTVTFLEEVPKSEEQVLLDEAA